MAATGGLHPGDIANILTGPLSVYVAPITAAVPTKLDNIRALVATAGGEYTSTTDWRCVGYTPDSPSYSRNLDAEGIEYEQSTGFLLERVTEQTREVTIPFGEFSSENLRMVEEGSANVAVAAGVGSSAQVRTDFGAINQRTPYRIALIGVQDESAGAVIEPAPSSRTRGRLIAVVLKRVTIAADEAEFEAAKGEAASFECTFTAFPESGEAAGKEYGFWIRESAGTIA